MIYHFSLFVLSLILFKQNCDSNLQLINLYIYTHLIIEDQEERYIQNYVNVRFQSMVEKVLPVQF